MSQTFAVWTLVIVAFCAANLPFLSERFVAVIGLIKPKTPWMRLLELLIFYAIVGAMGLALEQRAGQIVPQRWEFYAITATLFVTFAFPGFIYRYLLKHPA
jgi:membrane protein YqaA with SNARE-associated domain